MTYRGHVRNGTVVLDEPAALEEGAEVRVEIVDRPLRPLGSARISLAERLASVIGKAEGLPADWSEDHDAYLRSEYQE